MHAIYFPGGKGEIGVSVVQLISAVVVAPGLVNLNLFNALTMLYSGSILGAQWEGSWIKAGKPLIFLQQTLLRIPILFT